MDSPEYCHIVFSYKICATNFNWLSFTVASIGTIAAVSSIIIAIWQVSSLRRENAIQSTLTLLRDELNSPELANARTLYLKLLQSSEACDLTELIAVDEITPEREAITLLLNQYETIAISIRRRALDEKVLREYSNSKIISDYEAMKMFIYAVREKTQNPKIWSNFENLARRWLTTKHKS